MTTATDNAIRVEPEMEGAIHYAIELYLLGLGLEGGFELERKLGVGTITLNLFEIGQLGRKLTVCSEILSNLETFSVIERREDILELLEECRDEADQSVGEERSKGEPPNDDLIVQEARLVRLRSLCEWMREDLHEPDRLQLSKQSVADAFDVMAHCLSELTTGLDSSGLELNTELVDRVEAAGPGLDACGRVLRALLGGEMPVDDGIINLLGMTERFWLRCIETDHDKGLEEDVAHDELELEKVRALQCLVSEARSSENSMVGV
jgi:hypothetical protein